VTTLLLIDLSAIFWAAWHASANEELSAAFEKTLTAARRLIESEKADHVAIACDFPPYKRKAILPAYKANREAAPPLATEQLRKVEQRLRDDGLTVWSVPGYEADDIIATAAHIATVKGIHVVIASGDKDLLQCVNESVVAVSPITSNRYDMTGVADRMGVPPPLVGDLLALTGDKSDNIPGITGCGPKTAAAWLASYGSLEGVISHARELGRFAGVVEEKAEELRLWRRVIELDLGVPIRFEELFEEKVIKPLVKNEMGEGFEDDVDALDDATGEKPTEQRPELAPGPALPPGTELTLDMPRPQQAIVQHQHQQQQPQQQQQQQGIVTLQPRNMKQAWWLAGTILNSRLYQRFESQEAVCVTIVRGQELGLSAMTALDVIHIVEGRPTMHAHLITARAMAHPKCKYFRMVGVSTAESATYETWHADHPEPTRHTYTLAEAKAAGVCPMNPRAQPAMQEGRGGKMRDIRGNWEKRPAEMVRKTCAVQLTRIVYPDAALGLYATEELSDE
jgi:5'-3' exonuclease